MKKINTILITICGLICLNSCSSGSSSNQTSSMTVSFPTPYAGTFYPIYNSGAGQWLPPAESTPFNKVSAIFIAFAHAYPQNNGAILDYESGQVNEPENLSLLVNSAKQKNPQIKLIISLGWGKNDWTYISNDYKNNANIFVPSVIAFLRNNNLDGFDIDDEDIGNLSGNISQQDFDGVIFNLRQALDNAGIEDNKTYYLTITPAGNNQSGGIENTQIDSNNMKYFNLINIQTYFNPDWAADFQTAMLQADYPKTRMANGITTENCTPGEFPDYNGYAGLFNWDMTADSICNDYSYTKQIAQAVGYH